MNYNFELIDLKTLEKLRRRRKTLLPYKKIDGRKDERWNTKLIKSSIMGSLYKGDSIPHVAETLTKVLGMNESSAIRNARTAMTSAQNSGRLESYKEAEKRGIQMKKVWMATHDHRVRDWHLDLDGEMVDIDEPFENEIEVRTGHFLSDRILYPGDPNADPANTYNCRCTMKVALKGIDYD